MPTSPHGSEPRQIDRTALSAIALNLIVGHTDHVLGHPPGGLAFTDDSLELIEHRFTVARWRDLPSLRKVLARRSINHAPHAPAKSFRVELPHITAQIRSGPRVTEKPTCSNARSNSPMPVNSENTEPYQSSVSVPVDDSHTEGPHSWFPLRIHTADPHSIRHRADRIGGDLRRARHTCRPAHGLPRHTHCSEDLAANFGVTSRCRGPRS